MINPFTLPALGGALLAAVALGVHLGQSAIGLINPIYFQGPAVHPRDRGAALDESALPSRPPAYGELYGWEQGQSARAADCGDCAALRARDAYAYSAQVPYFGGPPEVRAGDVRDSVAVHVGIPEAAMSAGEAVEPPEPAPAPAPVLRYAHNPVAAEQAAEPPGTKEGAFDKYYRE